MANNTSSDINYMGFIGSVEVSLEDSCLHGCILYIDDLITYEGSNVAETIQSFQDAVDRYVAYCKSKGYEPNKPYSGSFNIRTGKEIHRKAVIQARTEGLSLNEFVTKAISDKLTGTTLAAVNSTFDYIAANTNNNAKALNLNSSGVLKHEQSAW